MGAVATTALLLGAAIAERDAAEAQRATDYAALDVSQQRLRLALDAGRMGVWDCDLATGAVRWTEALDPIHGLTPGSFGGTLEAFRALVHPDDRARVEEAIRDAVEQGRRYELEFRIVWPDGSVHWVATTGTVLRDGTGRALRMLGITADATGRHRLEDELRRRADELSAADRRKDEFL